MNFDIAGSFYSMKFGLLLAGSVELPDAMETIYQSALALGRHGAVSHLPLLLLNQPP